MQKKYENFMAMFIAVLTVLQKFIAAWQSSIAFTDSVNQFKNKKTAIDLLRNKSESGSKGVTEQKKIFHDKLAAQTFEIVQVLMAFYKKTNDSVSFHKVKITKTKLEKSRANKLISVAKNALEMAHSCGRAMADYQITQPILDEFTATLTAYEQFVPSPRTTIVERKVALKDLSNLFKDANLILTEQLDLMMVPYEKTNPDFYKEYMNARKVVQYGIRHEKGDKPDDTKPEDTKPV